MVSPPSSLLIKITATFLWQRLHSVGCILYSNSFQENAFDSQARLPPGARLYVPRVHHNYELVMNLLKKRARKGQRPGPAEEAEQDRLLRGPAAVRSPAVG